MSKLAAAVAGESQQMTPYVRFRGDLAKLRPEVAALCGKDQVDRFVRVTLNAVQSNPAVLTADRKTLLLACLKAAQDNLLPDGREAVFNVYRTKKKLPDGGEQWVEVVQYMPMAYGLIQKIYEAGATFVDGVAVYEQDEFDYQRGDEPKILHKPYKGDDSPGKVIAAYVIVKLRSGETKREVMFRRDIEMVRSKSKAPDGLMWKDFYDQGAIKSVVHRVVKQLPRAERLEQVLAHDAEAEGGLAQLTGSLAVDSGPNLEAIIEGKVEHAEVSQVEPKTDDQRQAPKKGDKGTPEMKAAYLKTFTECADTDVLSIKMDEARFFTWEKKDHEELTIAYDKRRQALTEE